MIKVVEAFSGIGSQAKALELLKKEDIKKYDYKILNTVEWDLNSIFTYDIIHNGEQYLDSFKNKTKEELIEYLLKHEVTINGYTPATIMGLKKLRLNTLKSLMYSIERTNNLGNIRNLTSEDFTNDIDIFTYSFPCQDLSNVGYFHGDNGGISREANNNSSILWEVERILEDFLDQDKDLPKILIMENVTSIRSRKHIDYFNDWIDSLKNLGYVSQPFDLCALDFGIPQTRKRTFMVSFHHQNDFKKKELIEELISKSDLFNSNFKHVHKTPSLSSFLRLDYDNEIYKNEALMQVPNDTPSRQDIYEKNPKLVYRNGEVLETNIRTLTTKQDRHPNSGIIEICKNNFDLSEGKSAYRFITPRESFLLMGFEEEDFNRLLRYNILSNGAREFITKDKMTKMAGNSIVVNVLVEVFREVIKIFNKIY